MLMIKALIVITSIESSLDDYTTCNEMYCCQWTCEHIIENTSILNYTKICT